VLYDFTAFSERDGLTVSSDHQESPYELGRSVVLNIGAKTHVYNDRTKLTDFRPAFEGERILAGSSYVSIVGWGTMRIQVKNGDAVQSLDIKDTAFILGIQGGVHWDTRRKVL
jgi:hypothetical protein